MSLTSQLASDIRKHEVVSWSLRPGFACLCYVPPSTVVTGNAAANFRVSLIATGETSAVLRGPQKKESPPPARFNEPGDELSEKKVLDVLGLTRVFGTESSPRRTGALPRRVLETEQILEIGKRRSALDSLPKTVGSGRPNASN